MCKKLIYLISFLFVLAMAAPSPAGLDDDPNLVAWWKFDGDATDSSGNGHHGTLMGDPAPVFADGVIDQALDTTESDGPGYLEITGYKGILGPNPFSIAMWINTSDGAGTIMGWGSTAGGTTRVEFRINSDRLRCESSGNVQGDTTLPNNEWIHVAVTVKGGAIIDDPDVTLYLNGENDTRTSTGSQNPLDMAAGYDVTIARRHTSGRWLDALFDDVRIYDRELTPEEVKALATPPRAHKPSPEDGAIHGDTWVSLKWSASYYAVSHDVYVGTNFDDVNDGTGETFQGNQTTTDIIMGIAGFLYPEGLPLGTTYYWRVDEVLADSTIQKGNIWSFFVPPKEAYNPDPIDEVKFIDPDVTLSWAPGMKAVLHTVYFGDNFDDVNNAAGALPNADATYNPGTLELDKTYYWRVDEFDGAETHKGDVQSFTTKPVIPITDPNLVGWWTFDESMGNNALDWSGHGNDGIINGEAQWVDGYQGTALTFGADDYVEAAGYPGITGTAARTLCAWVKTTEADRTIMSWGQNTAGKKWRMRSDATGGLRVEVNGGYNYGVTNIADGQWHHVAVTFEDDGTPDVLDTLLYVDGQPETTADSLDEPIDTDTTGAVRIGKSPYHNSGFIGVIDDARVYDKVLTDEEIKQAMRVDLLLAWNPGPANFSLLNLRDAGTLSWSAGDNASEHDVYFGTDKEAVNNADESDTTGVYRGRQGITSYNATQDVEWGGGPYCWRIDEYNTDGTISKGRIWNFTIADFIVIDDFESYNDLNPDEPASNRIFNAWIDGFDNPAINGSIVGHIDPPFIERTIIHGGNQSMPYYYDNGVGKSEATLTLTYPRNWTENGVGVLSLWFMGNPAGFIEDPVGTFTMSAAGVDIWDQADEFRYAYKQLSGAGSISAQVLSVENTNGWAKAGVMIRESLDPGSKFAAVYITPGNGCRFQARLQTGADAVSDSSVTTLQGITAPHWIKLERDAAGNFNAYNSDDGVNWTPLAWNPQNISMSANVYIGLALTSHNADATCVAEFSDVQTTGSVSPLVWSQEAIGATMLSNDPEPMYVALNESAVVHHDNPNAALADEWTEWKIDLQAFTDQGVNLTNVNTITLGFGNRSNPVAGGAGMVFFDDIRLYRPAP